MKTSKWIILITCLVAAGCYCISLYSANKPSAAADTPPGSPVATVTTGFVTKKTINERITAYRTVVPAPGAIISICVPFESRVINIPVRKGMYVSAGSELIEIEPSEAARLKIQEAKEACESARQNLEKVQERFNLKMTTMEKLIAAKHAFQYAQIRLKSLKNREITTKRQIRSRQAGTVYMIHVRRGNIVPAGTPLLDVLPSDSIRIRLGVEQEDVKSLHVKQPVLISHVNRTLSTRSKGSITMISKAIDPDTGLVNIFVSVSPPDDFLLGEYVRGRITIVSKEAMVVPRSAVLPEDGHYVLYTVDNGRAVKHVINPGLENNREIEIIDNNIKPGEQVVILGNYELKNGMPVVVEAGK